MLCGALANEYQAQLVDSIDTRITNRAIIIAGGVGQQQLQQQSNHPTTTRSSSSSLSNSYSYIEEKDINPTDDLIFAAKRNRMPKLIRS